MTPEEIPVFKADDMLPPCAEEYQIGERCSIIGWLKKLFLYGDDDIVSISPEDRKHYNAALAAFRKANGLSAKYPVEEFEDVKSNTRTKQAKALNKCIKELGYE